MRAAAEFVGITFVMLIRGDRHRADGLAVFFAEERHCALLDGFLARLESGHDRHIRRDRLVDDALDALNLFGGHRFGMSEVEAQAVGRDQRTRLPRVFAEHVVKRLVEQVGRGVVAHDVVAALCIHAGNHLVAHFRHTV